MRNKPIRFLGAPGTLAVATSKQHELEDVQAAATMACGHLDMPWRRVSRLKAKLRCRFFELASHVRLGTVRQTSCTSTTPSLNKRVHNRLPGVFTSAGVLEIPSPTLNRPLKVLVGNYEGFQGS